MKLKKSSSSADLTRIVGLIDRWLWTKPLKGSFETSQKRESPDFKSARFYE